MEEANSHPLDDLLREEVLRSRSSPSGERKKLRLLKEPRRRYLLDKDRLLGEIDPGVRQLLRRAVDGDLAWPLTLLGEPGRGKTAAALFLLDYTGGAYFTVEELGEAIIQAIDGRMVTPESKRKVHPEVLWSEIFAAPLVVLDELGTPGGNKDWAYRNLKRVLDGRERRPLILISNISINELEIIYDGRITSRLGEGTVVEIKGKDRRLKK